MREENKKITLQEFNEIYRTFTRAQDPPPFEHEEVLLATMDQYPHVLLRTHMGFEARRRVLPDSDVELLKQRNEKDHLWSVLARCGFEMDLEGDEGRET
jgi:hypothetical protein